MYFNRIPKKWDVSTSMRRNDVTSTLTNDVVLRHMPARLKYM